MPMPMPPLDMALLPPDMALDIVDPVDMALLLPPDMPMLLSDMAALIAGALIAGAALIAPPPPPDIPPPPPPPLMFIAGIVFYSFSKKCLALSAP